MREATMSLLGMYEYDSSILDQLQLPEEIDRDTFTANLMAETAEFEILYPNAIVLKNLIGIWSRKQLPIWQKMYATTQYEYNPIENYDRMETGSTSGGGSTAHTGTDTRTATTTLSGSDEMTGTGSDSRTGSRTNSGSDSVDTDSTTTHQILGFNSSVLVDQSADIVDGTSETTYGKEESTSETGENETSNTIEYGKVESLSDATVYGQTVTQTQEGEHTLRAHGNIGVTTTQEMIKQQREIEQFNIYDYIIHDFENRFCIMVY